MLPNAEEFWCVRKIMKIGCEVSFNRSFYNLEPIRMPEEIQADILVVERQPQRSLEGILAKGVPSGETFSAGRHAEGPGA